jgi:hypothetical protein
MDLACNEVSTTSMAMMWMQAQSWGEGVQPPNATGYLDPGCDETKAAPAITARTYPQ